jgi:hypothetical protein
VNIEMPNTIPTDVVVFRRWRESGTVIALFPDMHIIVSQPGDFMRENGKG